ncbi:Tubulin polyglutamylase TTLL5 [Paragonimus heterotremus]|uniref:Tubulin--tyrosine ligase-like protein 5 n=1 Tax=Paragonimus heterotremus TaxID=100268 RepID=A0A8J4SWA1_9TREM|nr:Tubulin polyglutamylase TTLL5 [Paragonimus heterotremus]
MFGDQYESSANNESAESIASESSLTLQSAFHDHSLCSEVVSKNGGVVFPASTNDGVPSNEDQAACSIRNVKTVSRTQQDCRKTLIIPFFLIGKFASGIMWSGNYRRSPIFIFSQACIVKKSDAAEKLGRLFNMSFRLVRTECKLLRCVLQSHGFLESNNLFGKFNLLWTGCHLKPSQLRLLSDFHKVNHFPRSYELTRKDRLAKNVQRMQRLKGLRFFDFVPASYILPEEFRELCAGYLQDRGPYIVKPIASSRGRGIYIVSHPEEIPYDEPVIVSRYISNPFLLDGFKFDVRLYAAVTSYEPLVVYLYEEGLVRFATVRYQYGARHLKTQCMHLTNYSVNKRNFEFVQNDDANVEDFGNKWSLGALLRYLKSEGADVTGLMVRIEDIIVKSFLSVVGPIASACNMFHASRSQCFELYGFDIIVDENFRPWLLEVNLSPSLACDSPLDFKVKSHMLTDLFNLVGLSCHDPTRKTQGGMNSLCVTASGETAVPPRLPTYFVTAEEYVATHSKTESHSGENFKRKQYPSRSSSNSSPSENTNSCLAGTDVSHLIPNEMTTDEARLMRRLQEEASRAGGWLRLLPSPHAWEHYASLWPNDSRTMYFSGDRRSLNCGNAYNGNVSLSTIVNRHPGWNPLVASAYSAAFAAYTLNEITHRLGRPQQPEHTGKEPNIKEHLLLADTGPIKSAKANYLHPNSSSIGMNLFAHLRSTGNDNEPTDHESNYVFCNHAPDSISATRTTISLHNMTHTQMRQHLQHGLNALRKPTSSDVNSQRVIACYMQTLGRMPFFLRKLGEQPVNLPGVFIYPTKTPEPNNHTEFLTGKLRSSKILVISNKCSHKQTIPRSNGSLIDLNSPSPETMHPTSRPASALSDYSESASRKQVKVEVPPATGDSTSITAAHLSASQARHAFATYLSRIQSRLLAESSATGGHVQRNAKSLRKESRQIDALISFLRRASRSFSNPALQTVWGKQLGVHARSTSSDLRWSSRIDVPDNKCPLNERKRILANLLEKFIRIYQYETVMVTSPQVTGGSEEAMKSVEMEHFWKFVDNASEQQLEALLTSYTRLHKSVSAFIGPERSETIPSSNSATSSRRSSSTWSKPEESSIHCHSTDSGLASSMECNSTVDPTPDLTVSSVSAVSSRKTPVASSHKTVAPVHTSKPASTTKLFSWSICCARLKSVSPECEEPSDKIIKRPLVPDVLCTNKPAPWCVHASKTSHSDTRQCRSKTKNISSSCLSPKRSQNSSFSQHPNTRIGDCSKIVNRQSHTAVLQTENSCQTAGAKISQHFNRPRNKSRVRPRSTQNRRQAPVFSTRQPLSSSASKTRIRSRSRPHAPHQSSRPMVSLCKIKSVKSSTTTNEVSVAEGVNNRNYIANPQHVGQTVDKVEYSCASEKPNGDPSSQLPHLSHCVTRRPLSTTSRSWTPDHGYYSPYPYLDNLRPMVESLHPLRRCHSHRTVHSNRTTSSVTPNSAQSSRTCSIRRMHPS